jgi:proline dehydrogenase
VALAEAGRAVRIYAPYGHDWLRYLLRRRAEAEGAA